MDDDKAHPRLLADIGGTHARFAWQEGTGAPITDESVLRCEDHAGIGGAIAHYLDSHGRRTPTDAAIGIANPVSGDHVQMTNRDWSFSIENIRQSIGLRRLCVLNDFKALALAVPALHPDELQPILSAKADLNAPLAVIGPGTGLGVATLLRTPRGDVAVDGEGGHVTLAAADETDAAVIASLRRRFGHVSAERVLSGPGLVNLYEAACDLSGRPADTLAPADVVTCARQGAERECVQALEWFVGFLGNVAGNVALTVGARGGVYIGGGIPPRIADRLTTARFRERFLGKGRFHSYLSSIPVWLIDTDSAVALRGASRALDSMNLYGGTT